VEEEGFGGVVDVRWMDVAVDVRRDEMVRVNLDLSF
jgi:hypothetical protein